jgi:hypothetical protein
MTLLSNKMIERQTVAPTADQHLSTSQPAVGQELRCGDLCPQCHAARLDYDGLLNLACPHCRYSLGGCFT